MAKNDTLFTTTLGSGLRLGHRKVPTQGIYCGVTIHAGSRYDFPHKEGLAHLVEHMLFKGTLHRNSIQILRRLEEVGGSLEAFTTKDYMCLYASAPRKYLRRAIELLADILFYSTFPTHELQKEIKVVQEEIHMYKDTPSEQIIDDYEEFFWQGGNLAHPILGTEESVQQLTAVDCKAFAETYFVPQNMAFSCLGDVMPQEVLRLVQKYFVCPYPHKQPAPITVNTSPGNLPTLQVIPHPSCCQAHVVIGGKGLALTHPLRPVAALLLSYLVGDSSTSLLNIELREKRGLVYTVEGGIQCMRYEGSWQIYCGCATNEVKKILRITHRQLDKVANKGISERTLNQWKKLAKGQMTLGEDDHESTFLRIAKELLYLGEAQTLEGMHKILDSITVEQCRNVAAEILAPNNRWTLYYRGESND